MTAAIRLTREETLMEIARTMSMRSTCTRAHVGAVIAKEGRIISTGYNGTPPGMAHCKHFVDDGPCTQAIHAETNAIIFAGRYGVSCVGADLYVTVSPCLNCANLIIAAGIKSVIWDSEHRDLDGLVLLRAVGIV